MSIVVGKYSSEYMEYVNGVATSQEAIFTIATDDETSHAVDALTFAETNLGDDIEVTTVVTVKTTSQVASLGTTVG